MATRRQSGSKEPASRRRQATTPEGRENQLVALAVDLAEKQLSEGTASAQVISHFLKLGSTREQLEQERLRRENEFLRAKSEAMESSKNAEELYKNALVAMRGYAGLEDPPDTDEFND